MKRKETIPIEKFRIWLTGYCRPSIESNKLFHELRLDSELLSLGLLFPALRLLFAVAAADVDGAIGAEFL